MWCESVAGLMSMQSRMLLQRLNVASDSVNDLLKPQNRAAVGTILANVRDLSRDLRAIMVALSGRIDSISQHLEVASRNFDEFAREVRMNPNRLLVAPKGDKVEEEPK